jgi:hypothetical protein
MPGVIPQLAKPVTARPFFSEELSLPRGNQDTGLTALHQLPGSINVFLVLHQKGMIWMLKKTAQGEEKNVFADLTGEVFSDRGPNGLQDLAFTPKFRQNRKYYLHYQVVENGTVTTLIVEKEFATDFMSDSGRPPRRLLKIVSVAEDHSGGCLQFGPDGFLYVVMGDTGPQKDPNGHAQNLQLLPGKVMRIDVDHAEDGAGAAWRHIHHHLEQDGRGLDGEADDRERHHHGGGARADQGPWLQCRAKAHGEPRGHVVHAGLPLRRLLRLLRPPHPAALPDRE